MILEFFEVVTTSCHDAVIPTLLHRKEYSSQSRGDCNKRAGMKKHFYGVLPRCPET